MTYSGLRHIQSLCCFGEISSLSNVHKNLETRYRHEYLLISFIKNMNFPHDNMSAKMNTIVVAGYIAAISTKGVKSLNRLAVYLLAIGAFITGTAEFVVSGILELIASDLQISIAAAGQLITIYSISYAVGALVLVMVTARYERKRYLSTPL